MVEDEHERLCVSELLSQTEWVTRSLQADNESSAVHAADYKCLSVIQTVKRVKRLSQKTLKYENHLMCCYLTCTQAWSWSNCLSHKAVSECDIILTTWQNTFEHDLLWDCEPSAQKKQWELRETNMTASLALRNWSCQWSWQWMQCCLSHVENASLISERWSNYTVWSET